MAKNGRSKRPDRRRRAPPMTQERVTGIVALIDGWKGPLTWEALCEAFGRETGARYTRQALNKYVEIKSAYAAYNSKPTPHNVEKMSKSAQKILKLERRITELEATRDILLEKFVRWSYNASTRNLDEQFLDQPLFRINRSKNR